MLKLGPLDALTSQGALRRERDGLAVVDSELAFVLMVKAANADELSKIRKALSRIELDFSHGISERWQLGFAEYKAALEQFRTRKRIRWVAGNRFVKGVLRVGCLCVELLAASTAVSRDAS